jgi:hypothetical protein
MKCPIFNVQYPILKCEEPLTFEIGYSLLDIDMVLNFGFSERIRSSLWN